MKTTPLQPEEFAASPLAVPPLARHADLRIDDAQNIRLVRHIEAGGLRTLLYGGNANLYHSSVADFAHLLSLMAEAAGPETRVIPSIGPDFGKMMEQARLLRGTGYRTAMVLPMQGFTSPEGVVDGLSRVSDAAGMSLTLYLKSESYIDVERLGKLVDDGRVLVLKYAIVRADPARDDYLRALIQRIGAGRIVSGMGERPILAHVGELGLASFTTGSGCIAPKACLALLRALQQRDAGRAQQAYELFMPLETLRDSISLIRVLHDAVTLSGVADMGAHLPLLSPSPAARMAEIQAQARALLACEQRY